MSDLVKAALIVVAIFSFISYVTLYISLTNGFYGIMQGDPNATQKVVDIFEDRVYGTIRGEIIAVIIGLVTVLGGAVIAVIKYL